METPTPTFKEKDATMLLAALQNSTGPITVNKEALSKQLGLAPKTLSNNFARIKKEYNLDLRFSGLGEETPKKRKEVDETDEPVTPTATPKKAKTKKTPVTKRVNKQGPEDEGDLKVKKVNSEDASIGDGSE